MSSAFCGTNGAVSERFYGAAQEVVCNLRHGGHFMGYNCQESWIDCGAGRIVRVATLNQCPFPENNFIVETYRLGAQDRLVQTSGADTSLRLGFETMVQKVREQGYWAQVDIAAQRARAKRGELDLSPIPTQATKHDGTIVPLTPMEAMPSVLQYREVRPRPASQFKGYEGYTK